jgi:hypothetical protein
MMRNGEATEDETLFFAELIERVPGLQNWYHEDPDGTAWMIVSSTGTTASGPWTQGSTRTHRTACASQP